MKIKTNLLTGAALDWAVAMCEGATEEWRADGPFLWRGWPVIREHGSDINYSPSSVWADAGPILEREGIWLRGPHDATTPDGKVVMTVDYWYAHIAHKHVQNAHKPLVAAMRCYVASKLGEEVEVLVGR